MSPIEKSQESQPKKKSRVERIDADGFLMVADGFNVATWQHPSVGIVLPPNSLPVHWAGLPSPVGLTGQVQL